MVGERNEWEGERRKEREGVGKGGEGREKEERVWEERGVEGPSPESAGAPVCSIQKT